VSRGDWKECRGKIRYLTDYAAAQAMKRAQERGLPRSHRLRYYDCALCGGWHLSSHNPPEERLSWLAGATPPALERSAAQVLAIRNRIRIARYKLKTATQEDLKWIEREIEGLKAELQTLGAEE
jgi:hypothetical protein